MADHESRVSQGGEGHIRRVTSEEQKRIRIDALTAGCGDVQEQRGWDLAAEFAESEYKRLWDQAYSLLLDAGWDPEDIDSDLRPPNADSQREETKR